MIAASRGEIMDPLNYFLSKVDFPRTQRSSSSRIQRRLNLEELERRDALAPVVANPAMMAGILSAHTAATSNISQASFNIVQGLSATGASASGPGLALTFALQNLPFTGAASVSLGFPTAAVGFETVTPTLFSSSAAVSPGAPNPVRTGPGSPLTPGALAPLTATARYITEDISLSGGGGALVDYRALPPDELSLNDPQLRIEDAAVGSAFFDVNPTATVSDDISAAFVSH
jgi:hypothetical protein